MRQSRRFFLGQSLVLMADAAIAASRPAGRQHLVLLGDSILDNDRYTGGKPAVIAQVRKVLPPDWKASLLAVDGTTTDDMPSQLARLPGDATHLVLSIGGNNALRQTQVLDLPVKSSAEALLALAEVVGEFETAYRQVIDACLKHGLPLVACTIYNGNFPDANYRTRARIALATFNDAIIRIGTERQLTIIELRHLCNKPEDYANAIEPSAIGGAKIAQTIVQAVTAPAAQRQGAYVIGAPARAIK